MTTNAHVTCPPEVLEKVEQFREGLDLYKSDRYKEARARADFIDPFFAALGWDIHNSAGHSEIHRDVVIEDSLKIDASTKAPDYSFRLGGARQFFVEAKRPRVVVESDSKSAYQLRRYQWNANLLISVLTDFEELAVYELSEPNRSDNPEVARILYVTYDEYETRWGEIHQLLSREEVLNGSVQRAAEAAASRNLRQVDAAFLSQIEQWRKTLAEDAVAMNSAAGLSRGDLNFIVQATIDRIVFLRFCEDRGLEAPGQLAEASESTQVYSKLMELFQRADRRYNSGLFHFTKEPGRDVAPDTLTPSISLSDGALTTVISELYAPRSPFEFSVLPPDILGRAYEQFLGSQIVFSGASVKVEQKPDVRKAGGVYYTPQYVVERIVNESLRPHLDPSRSVADIERLTVVDPSCGSGSFLVTVYQALFDWYLERYIAAPPRSRFKQRIFRAPNGSWRLTLDERKRILTTHVYGVDLDPQAVEVAKLSLLLKVIEGETQTALAVDRLLPDLSSNILCGDSLIGPDFHSMQTLGGAVPDLGESIRPFSWTESFPAIFERGGFDAVVGNPPYLNIDSVWGKSDPRLGYLKEFYPEIHTDKTDLLFYFLKRALDIARPPQSGSPDASVSFIVSRAFLEADKATKLRSHLSVQSRVREIIDHRGAVVFKGVGIATAILHLEKAGRKESPATRVRQLRENALPSHPTAAVYEDARLFDEFEGDVARLGSKRWTFVPPHLASTFDHMDSAGSPVGEILHIGQGMQTGRNSVFGGRTSSEIASWGVPFRMAPIRARNSDIDAYAIRDSGTHILYLEDVANFDRLPLGVQDHLKAHEAELQKRAAYKRGNCDWWKFTWPLHKEYFDRARILAPYRASKNRFALDKEARFLGLTDTTVLYDAGQQEDLRYILGILNSTLLTLRYRYIGKLTGEGMFEYFENGIAELPIPRVGRSSKEHKAMVDLVQRRIEAAEDLAAASSPADIRGFKDRIQQLDRLIDRTAIEAFGLDLDVADLPRIEDPAESDS